MLSGIQRGSSMPVVVTTSAGTFVTKLRGAAQGILPLIAEILVAEIAGALALPVPERVRITLDETVPTDDRRDELADLLARSHGDNLGFRLLEGAADLRSDQLRLVDDDTAARTLWLDGLVMNPDRTPRNPNILLWHRSPWLIDHGACLAFHYDFAAVTEDSPRERAFDPDAHLFATRAERLARVDEECARLVPRDVLIRAAAKIPDDFLTTTQTMSPERARAAYVAFLWKRLKAPRPFVGE